MIVDAHVHIWKQDLGFPNPAATFMSPTSDIPLELLGRYMDEHGVGRAVLVQPMYPGEDNSLIADAARAEPGRYAAVCVVDPRLPEAPDRLEFWVKERGCRGLRLLGVRHQSTDAAGHDPGARDGDRKLEGCSHVMMPSIPR